MKLLYFYMKFLDDQGEAKPFRGLNEIELNLSAQDLFHYDSKNNRLERKRRTTPLPENFWVNEAVKDLDTPGHDPSKITNVNVIAGENGSGKSTVIQVFIDLLDALYGSFTGRDRQPLSRHDPRPHRFLLLMEGETERTKKDEHPLVRYLMDYSPQTAQQNPSRLDNSYYKEGMKYLTFSFHDWSALSADAKSIEWKGNEQSLRARDEIRNLLTKTKVVYMTNTLNQRDFVRHTSRETNQRLRDFFVYDCSLGATVGPDIAQFFPYEVYKQVKYVFDRNQRVLRQTMYNLIPELRIPHSLRLLPRFEIFSDFLEEQDSDPEGSETQKVQRTLGNDPLTNILGTLCIAGFAFNLAFYANRRPYRDIKWIASQIIRSLRFGSNPQKLNRTDFSKQLIEVEENLRALFANDNHSGLGVSCVIETKGGQLVSGSGDNTLRVWDPATGECLRTLERHSGPVTCVIETKGGQLVSGSYDGTLRVWDPATGECLRTLEGHRGKVNCVIETKGGQLVSGSDDKTLRVWDSLIGKCLRTLEGHEGHITCVIETKGGQFVSGSEDETLRVWNPATSECFYTLDGHKEPVTCVIETKGGQFVSGSWDNALRVWDPATGECLRTLEGHRRPVTCVIETKGGQLVSGSEDGTLRVWNPATSECFCTLDGHRRPVTCVIETKGGQLVSGSEDGTLRVWDPATGECLCMLWKNPFWKETHALEDNCVKYLEFLVEKADTLFSKFRRVDELTFELPIDALEEAQPEQTNHTEIANTSSLYEDLVTFIQKYRYTCEPTYTIDFDWGLSSGEENMLRLFSNLYHVFDRDYNNPNYGPYAIYNNEKHRPFRELTEPCDTVLLFMDEADLTLHPEWQRRLIHLLTAFLPRIYPAPMTKELQLLLTTHSPLLLGDIPKENVTYLTSGGQVISSEEKDENSPGESFGQNIHTLLRQSFFLRDGTVGEFAAAKINATAAGLQKIIEEKACSSPEEMETLRRTVALTAPGILRAELERLLREAELALQPEQQFPIEQLLSTVKHLTPHQRAELLEALEREGNQ